MFLVFSLFLTKFYLFFFKESFGYSFLNVFNDFYLFFYLIKDLLFKKMPFRKTMCIYFKSGFLKNHFFQIVNSSWVPLFFSISILFFIFFFIKFFNFGLSLFFFNFLFFILLFLFSWFFLFFNEFKFFTIINWVTQSNVYFGMSLFMISEVMLFFSFFWAFFDFSVAPSVFLGNTWPFTPMIPLDALLGPFLNTLMLLISGVTANLFGWIFVYY